MGKNSVIKTISTLIAGMTAHKILLEHANKPESLNHLESEIGNYKGNISDEITEYNWNEQDKEKIKTEAKKILQKKLKEQHFQGIVFSAQESSNILDETIGEFFS